MRLLNRSRNARCRQAFAAIGLPSPSVRAAALWCALVLAAALWCPQARGESYSLDYEAVARCSSREVLVREIAVHDTEPRFGSRFHVTRLGHHDNRVSDGVDASRIGKNL